MAVLAEHERWAIINGLHAAAAQYKLDANSSGYHGGERIAQQFNDQASEALRIADMFENAGEILIQS